MNFDPTITIGNVIAILIAIGSLIGVVWAFNLRVVRVETIQVAHLSRIEALEQADESIRREVRAVRAEVGTQFKVLQAEIRQAFGHMQGRMDTIFLQLGRTIGRDVQ